MDYIKSHYRAGYYRHNKDGSVTYVKGSNVKAHYKKSSYPNLSHDRVLKTDRYLKASESNTYYSEYDALKPNPISSKERTQRLRITDKYNNEVKTYSYDPKTNTTIEETKDSLGRVTTISHYGNTIPQNKKPKGSEKGRDYEDIDWYDKYRYDW